MNYNLSVAHLNRISSIRVVLIRTSVLFKSVSRILINELLVIKYDFSIQFYYTMFHKITRSDEL